MFDRGQGPPQDADIGVARAGVVETAVIAVGKSGCGENLRHHRAGASGDACDMVNCELAPAARSGLAFDGRPT